MRRAPKSSPFSIRLSAESKRFVEDEAERLQRAKGAIVEAYVAEGIRTRRFAGIGFRGEDFRRRAWVLGTGLDVWEIVALLRDFGSPEELGAEYGLTPAQIHIATAYATAFPEEIDELIARGRRSEAEALERHPFIARFEPTAPAGNR